MWQKEYKKKRFYWRLKPTKGLKEVLKYTRRGIALDIGAGEGRNSISLAKAGFKVEAIDKIKEGLDKCEKFAEKYNLPIKTRVIDVRKFKFEKNKYSLILSIVTLDFLKFSETRRIIQEIKKSLIKGGVFYLGVFSTEDPALKECKKKRLKSIEKNTFYFPKFDSYRHFFEKKELLNVLKDFKIIKIEEKRTKNTHGGKIHFHQGITIIVKK